MDLKDLPKIRLADRIQEALKPGRGNPPLAEVLFPALDADPMDLATLTLQAIDSAGHRGSAISAVNEIGIRVADFYHDQILKIKSESGHTKFKDLWLGDNGKPGTPDRLQLGAWLLTQALQGRLYSVEQNKKGQYEIRIADFNVIDSDLPSYTKKTPFAPWTSEIDDNGRRLVRSWEWQPDRSDFTHADKEQLTLILKHTQMFDDDFQKKIEEEKSRHENYKYYLDRELISYGKVITPENPAVYIQAINSLEAVPFQINNNFLDTINTLDKEFTFYNDNEDRREQFLAVLKMAKKYKDGPFYQRAQLDYRGRVYLSKSILNYQGADEARALIEFHEGSPFEYRDELISAMVFLKPILIHAANIFGTKGSKDDRAKWGLDNVEKMMQCAHDPINTTWWQDADKKFCFLRMCIELRDCLRSSVNGNSKHITHLPIELDASNSGYQHYALMARDTELAKLCNVVPVQPKRGSTIFHQKGKEDLYKTIARKVRKEFPFDLKKPPSTNEVRKAIKEIAVPRGYGAGKDKILEDLRPELAEKIKKRIKGKGVVKKKAGKKKQAKAQQIKIKFIRNMSDEKLLRFIDATMRAIEEVAPIVGEVRKFLQDEVGLAAIKEQDSFEWKTLSGFTAVISPKIGRRYKVKIYPPDRPPDKPPFVELVYYKYSDKLNKKKLAKQIAPSFVHSQDAAVVHLVLATIGVPIVTIHDAFAVLASDAWLLTSRVERAMQKLYLYSPLQGFADHTILTHTPVPPIRDPDDDMKRLLTHPFSFSIEATS